MVPWKEVKAVLRCFVLSNKRNLIEKKRNRKMTGEKKERGEAG